MEKRQKDDAQIWEKRIGRLCRLSYHCTLSHPRRRRTLDYFRKEYNTDALILRKKRERLKTYKCRKSDAIQARIVKFFAVFIRQGIFTTQYHFAKFSQLISIKFALWIIEDCSIIWRVTGVGDLESNVKCMQYVYMFPFPSKMIILSLFPSPPSLLAPFAAYFMCPLTGSQNNSKLRNARPELGSISSLLLGSKLEQG